MPLVFVYGTLKRGEYNHPVMERSAGGKFISEANVVGFEKYFTQGRPYPFVKPNEGHTLSGEVYDVPDEGMVSLDRLEGVPHLYERVQTETDEGHTVNLYVANKKFWELGP